MPLSLVKLTLSVLVTFLISSNKPAHTSPSKPTIFVSPPARTTKDGNALNDNISVKCELCW